MSVWYALQVDYMVVDELFYFPLPLDNVKGFTLDIHHHTIATGYIESRRPWWSAIILLGGIVLAAIATLEALVAYDILSSTSDKSKISLSERLSGVEGVNDTSYHLPMVGIGTGLVKRNFYMLVGGYFAILLAPLIYYYWHTYHRSDFRPKMKQRRQIVIGALDPITQKQKAFKLLLDDRYQTTQIRDYLALLQEYCPHVAGQVHV